MLDGNKIDIHVKKPIMDVIELQQQIQVIVIQQNGLGIVELHIVMNVKLDIIKMMMANVCQMLLLVLHELLMILTNVLMALM